MRPALCFANLPPPLSLPPTLWYTTFRLRFPSAKGGPPMAQQPPHVIPSIYLANYLNDFELLFPRYGVTPLGRKKRWKGSNIKKAPISGRKASPVKKRLSQRRAAFLCAYRGRIPYLQKVYTFKKEGGAFGRIPPALRQIERVTSPQGRGAFSRYKKSSTHLGTRPGAGDRT